MSKEFMEALRVYIEARVQEALTGQAVGEEGDAGDSAAAWQAVLEAGTGMAELTKKIYRYQEKT